MATPFQQLFAIVNSRLLTFLVIGLALVQLQAAGLPEGTSGIASEYQGDKGIANHPKVLFTESFADANLETIYDNWESVQDKSNLSLSNLVPNGSSDTQSLLITHRGRQGTGSHLYRRLPPGLKRVYARWYVRFDEDCWPIHHFGTHLGGFNPATPWPQGGAGTRPDGTKRFTSGVEPFGKNWNWDFYTYWQGMHRHGDGNYWGTPFLQGAPKPKVKKGKWICVEMMILLNDPPNSTNGEQAFWIDGKLARHQGQVISHIGAGFPKGEWKGGWWSPNASSEENFEGFAWRSTAELDINYIWTYLYITKAPRGHVSKVWFDQIVVATEYIGPMTSP